MFRFIKWFLLSVMGLLVLAVSTLVVVVLVRENDVVDAPYPDLHASTDPAVIERGKYLVEGPAHCMACHGDREKLERGATEIPLSGGAAFHLPLGTYFTPNITPDPTFGIGRYTDGELARVIRYGVNPAGKVMLPVMAFSDLTDDDVVALISYLRAQPPVAKEQPGRSLTALGRVVHALVLEPYEPTQPIRKSMTPGPTVEYGEYLATSVAECVGCHTQRNLKDGSYTGPKYAGGFKMEEPTGTFVTVNLTPHPSGKLAGWTEADFIARFRAGGNPNSPMPWSSYRRMSDDDLRALYRFLRTVPAAEMPRVD
jgi:mono/diheme cytochrome c family protein